MTNKSLDQDFTLLCTSVCANILAGILLLISLTESGPYTLLLAAVFCLIIGWGLPIIIRPGFWCPIIFNIIYVFITCIGMCLNIYIITSCDKYFPTDSKQIMTHSCKLAILTSSIGSILYAIIFGPILWCIIKQRAQCDIAC